jgi:single-strand DNA-binding protein
VRVTDNNTVTVVGSVTRDPELKFQVAGEARIVLPVAVKRRWRNPKTDEWRESTSFLDVVCWGDLAHNVSESAERGARVVVTGRIEQRSWQSKGRTNSKTEIIADEVALSLRWATAKLTKSARTSVTAEPPPAA